MFDDPTLTLSGNLTADPELRYTPAGVGVATFTLAYTPRSKQQDGTYKDGTTLFMRCEVWRELGEHLAESVTKGARLLVTGTVRQEDWEDKETGQKRSALKLTVVDVGPSLKYAVASVRKAARGNGDAPPPEDPWTGETATQRAPAGAR